MSAFFTFGWLRRVGIFLALWMVGFSLARGDGREDFLIQSWNVENGLPNDMVRALVRDGEGRLWVGTDGGLACFNGRKFEVFTPKTDPILRDGKIISLGCTREGVLWMGTKEGYVYRRVDGMFERVEVAELGGAAVLNFEEDREKSLYVSLSSGQVARWKDGKWEVLSRRENWPKGATQVHVGENDLVWVTGVSDCYQFRDEKLVPYMGKTSYRRLEFHSPGRNGGYWISADEFLGLYDPNQSQLSLNVRPALKGGLNQALEDRTQHLWLATRRDGLVRYDQFGQVIHLTKASGLPSDEILRLYQDVDGNLWGGTDAGLILIRKRLFEALDLRKWLGENEIRALRQDRDGVVWVAGGKQVWKLEKNEFLEQEEFRGKEIVAMAEVGEEMWFVDEAGNGFVRNRGERGLTRMVDFVKGGKRVLSILSERKGVVWVGQEGTKVLWRRGGDGVWREFSFPEGVSFVDIIGLQSDVRGGVWVATKRAGVFLWKDGKITQVFGDAFFPEIQTFSMDEQGCLWVGTRGGGLYRWKNHALSVKKEVDGLPGNVVGQFFDDGAGYFWMGTNRGIFRILKENLRMFYEGKHEPSSFVLYGEEDGVPKLRCLTGSQVSGFFTKNGEVLFPMEHTLVAVEQVKLSEVMAAPKVRLRRVVADEREVWSAREGKRVLELPFGTKKIHVEYEGISYQSSRDLHYRVQLIGGKRLGWEFTDLEKKEFDGLEAGEYRCLVQVANREGNWSSDAEEIPIVIHPPYWKTKKFVVLVTVLAGCGLGSLLFWRTRRAYRRKLGVLWQQSRVERERARIARDIHDGLGAKVAQIRMMLGRVARAEYLDESQRRVFQSLDELSVELIESLDETVWVVTPKNDRLRQLVDYMVFYAESVCRRVEWGCEFVYEGEFGDEEVATEIRHELFLIYKELIANALKHSGGDRLKIEFVRDSGVFEVRVRDFGCGFEVGRETNRNGLKNLGERVKKMRGELEIQSGVGEGTRICVRIIL